MPVVPVVFSDGALAAVRSVSAGLLPPATYGGVTVIPGDPIWLGPDYASIYRAHPFIRCCVDFLARNIGQLGLHLYRRQNDGGRERVLDHPVAQLLERPNRIESRFDHMAGTMSDLGIYGVGYWLKWGPKGDRVALLRVPPTQLEAVQPSAVGVAQGYAWVTEGRRLAIDPADLIRFRWFDPDPSRCGLSPIESLRRIVAEDRAATAHRVSLWQSGARIGGVIERPRDAGLWSPEARERFRAQWLERYSGPQSTGQVPVLEDGMQFKPVTMSLADTQASDMRAANQEDIARVYQIPAPMVGILSNATYSNIKEQHKHLYQDCLGPICAQIEDVVMLSLISEFDDLDDAYVEFNIAEKLKGSFEEQARALQVLVGRPVMTLNEGRAKLNLPAVAGGDEVAMPLNLTTAVDAPTPLPDETDHAPRGVVQPFGGPHGRTAVA